MIKENNIRAIIVDDEEDAHDLLTFLLNKIEDIQIVGQANNVDTAIQLILEHKPEIIFLDIEMPGKSGFDLIHELDHFDHNPTIIFTTAYNEYAIEAIRHAAFDYLLKPIGRLELGKAIERYKHRRNSLNFQDQSSMLIKQLYPRQLRYRTINGFVVIRPEEVIYCMADGNYTMIFMQGDNRVMVTAYLSTVFNQLPKEDFFRISRSIVINLNLLHRVNRKTKQCELKIDGQHLHFPIAAKHIAVLESRFE
jgi:DNA-binding LytR/AlgR family response regulator